MDDPTNPMMQPDASGGAGSPPPSGPSISNAANAAVSRLPTAGDDYSSVTPGPASCSDLAASSHASRHRDCGRCSARCPAHRAQSGSQHRSGHRCSAQHWTAGGGCCRDAAKWRGCRTRSLVRPGLRRPRRCGGDERTSGLREATIPTDAGRGAGRDGSRPSLSAKTCSHRPR